MTHIKPLRHCWSDMETYIVAFCARKHTHVTYLQAHQTTQTHVRACLCVFSLSLSLSLSNLQPPTRFWKLPKSPFWHFLDFLVLGSFISRGCNHRHAPITMPSLQMASEQLRRVSEGLSLANKLPHSTGPASHDLNGNSLLRNEVKSCQVRRDWQNACVSRLCCHAFGHFL